MPDPKSIRLAYSPDSDDAFMFWAIARGRIDTRGLSFEHTRADTEALNRGSEASAAPDVTALSIHQYAYLADRYLLLPHGGSVGAGYGPVLVAREPRTLASAFGQEDRRAGTSHLRLPGVAAAAAGVRAGDRAGRAVYAARTKPCVRARSTRRC